MIVAIIAGLASFILICAIYVFGGVASNYFDREYLFNSWSDTAHELIVMTRRHDAIAKQAFAMRRLIQRNNERDRQTRNDLIDLAHENRNLKLEIANLKSSLQGMFDWSNAQQRKAAS